MRIPTRRYRLSPKSSALVTILKPSLERGEIGIFPTETVYGIGAHAFRPRSLSAIRSLKGRAWNKPIALLVSRIQQVKPLVETIPSEAHRLVRKFCPGPLTLILKASPLGKIAMGGHPTIGIRIPDMPFLLALIEALGVPLAATSANRSGKMDLVTALAAEKLFGGKVHWIVDGGKARLGRPSTVVDLSHYPYTVTRQGAIPKRALEEALWGPAGGGKTHHLKSRRPLRTRKGASR